MEYEGKRVWTQDDFEFCKAQIGDYVEQAVVDDVMDYLPPACMTRRCSQMGEPYSHREDPDSGEWRPTFATFTKVAGTWPNGIWRYCGHCFRGEIEERGREPQYI